ncbi:MAG: hypothetical protein GC204_15665 [Chloroflexi bacterium]|nr:hypothetical protein [Chloroflexota bacterium]
MSQKLITLPISDELYKRVQKVAEASKRSPEALLAESLEDFFHFGDDLPSLEALTDYSSLQLWRVVLNDLSPSEVERLHELSEKNKWETLTQGDEKELDHLIELVDQYMLLRSQALVLLKERGEDINLYLNARI